MTQGENAVAEPYEDAAQEHPAGAAGEPAAVPSDESPADGHGVRVGACASGSRR